jgi:Kef-type K+ transport system membrane component KefB
VGILNDAVLQQITPLLRSGLAWIGLVIGLRFDARLFQAAPRRAGSVVALSAALPFVFVVGSSALVLLALGGVQPGELREPDLLRNALILGAAAAMTARSAARSFTTAESGGFLYRVILLEETAGILALALVASTFRPTGPEVSWQLPAGAWFLLTIGLGTTIGLLAHVVLQRARRQGDFLVLALGSVAFAAGSAGYLHVSSVVVCFVAGVMLANFPGDYRDRFRDLLGGMERPVYLLSLVVVGALWRYDDWRGWVLMPVFCAARLAGKALAASIGARRPGVLAGSEERRALAISPVGAPAIAIVISARLLYPDASISLVVSSVLGGSVLTEVFVQVAARRAIKRAASAPAAEQPARSEGA